MKKFLIFVSLFCLVFSIMTVSVFAYEGFSSEYVFKEVLDGSNGSGSWSIDFISNSKSFSSMDISARDGYVYSVSYYDGDWVTVYSDGKWLDFEYRFLIIKSIADTDSSYADFHSFLELNADPDPPDHSSLFYVSGFLVSWLGSALTSVISLFFVNGSLTLFGILSLVSLGLGLSFVLINVIYNFIRSSG